MVALQGELTITANGISAHLVAEGSALHLELDDPIAFFRASQMFHKSRLDALRLLAAQLDHSGLTLTISSRDQILAVIGSEARSGMAGSLLGVPHLEIQAGGLIARMAG